MEGADMANFTTSCRGFTFNASSLNDTGTNCTNLSAGALHLPVGDTADPAEVMTGVHYFYLIIQFVFMIVGNVGNVMVIGAVLVSGKLYTAGNIFIMNLAVADLWVTSFVDAFSIVGILLKHEFFADKTMLCEVVASTCLIACIASLWNIMAISINRYIFICKNTLYKKVYTKRNTILMAVGIWLGCTLMDLPNFLGWGGHVYDHKTMVCTYERTASYSYTVFFLTLSVFTPQAVVCFCYLKVYLLVRSQRRRIVSLQMQFGGNEVQVKRKDIQLLKTFFAIFLVFFICWGPYAVVVLVDFEDRLPQWLHIVIITMAHGNSSLNSVFYGLLNKQFRKSYCKVLSTIGCCPHGHHFSVATSVGNISEGVMVNINATAVSSRSQCNKFQPREPVLATYE